MPASTEASTAPSEEPEETASIVSARSISSKEITSLGLSPFPETDSITPIVEPAAADSTD